MKRFRLITIGLAGALVLAFNVAPFAAAQPAAAPSPHGKAAFHNSQEPVCESPASVCTDPYNDIGDAYVGHDEPSVEF